MISVTLKKGGRIVTLLQLQYFRTIAKVLHYTKAAQLLNISQPSLSYSLAELEREMGVPLLKKEGKKVHLSWYGEIFLTYVERSLEILDQGVKKVESLQDCAKGSVHLGYFHSISSTYIPTLVNQFYKDAGNMLTSFYFMMDQQQALMAALKRGQLDLAICPFPDPETTFRKIWTQELFLVVPRSHRLGEMESVPLRAVDGEPFIPMDKQSGIRRSLEKMFREHDIHPNYTFEANECAGILTYVSLGLGLAITPRIHELPNGDIKFIKISEPVCERNVYLSWIEGRAMNPAVQEVRDYILARPDIYESTK